MSKKIRAPRWDLSDLYSGLDDPKIAKDKKTIEKLTQEFIKNYKGKINAPQVTAALLKKAIQDMEAIDSLLYIVGGYASFLHSADSKSEEIGAFYQAAEEFYTKITSELLWFSLEIQQMKETVATKLLKDASLSEYRHYLQHVRVFSPYKLTEPEEIILTKKGQTGSEAFVRFYDETLSNEKIEIVENKKKKQLSLNELPTYLNTHKNRNLRKQTSEKLSQHYKNRAHFYTFILNTLLLDKKVRQEIRGYQYPEQSTFLSYEVTPEIVNAMVTAIQRRQNIAVRYYKAKAKLLNLPVLHEWDRYSSIYPESFTEYSWAEAKKLILENFEKFSKDFANIAEKFFDNNWIDAEARANKRAGAYCSYSVPSKHPYISMNFNGGFDDVSTLAHELGHGIHVYLGRENKLVNYWPSTATAEIASIFAESILFDSVYTATTDKKVKINLLADKIQGACATIFRQTAFYLFEEDINKHRREIGELKTDDINNYYQKRLQPMFGKSLQLTEGHAYWWINIGHFYHYNFYVFTYAMGEALTNALYAQYKVEGQAFADKYIAALKAGGSQSPIEITKMMGVDITDPNFWNQGLDLLEEHVKEFEQLVKQS